ncbi:RNA polymerase sigma-28 factor [Candidatus Desulfosporosinus infrequens]|uniref:RNA polymerase sigma factor n=1 Tax=Candidatus Desulfosporosinus infrequens TaxID=2043169 RepID=A0A2U3KDC5_9FIRM|nr:RNA polymerase sigma-28 factor [Candidatus Desulfosporosinus infrequens]
MFGEFVVASIALSVLKGFSLLVSYINNNAFPQPLSKQDEAHYLKILSESKTEPFTLTREVEKARNILVEHNLRLVAHLVKKYDGTEEDVEDLISIGTIGLIKGINTFDPSKGIKLASYAGRCIENEILMYFRAKRKSKGEISIYDPIGMDKEGNAISLIEVLVSNEEDISLKIINESERKALFELIKKLNHKEKLVIQLRYGLMNSQKRTQLEIAKIMDISRSYVSRIEKKALQKLMEDMGK